MRWTGWIVLAAAVTLAAPTELWGQGRGRDKKKDRARTEEVTVWVDDIRDLDDLDDDETYVVRDRSDRIIVIDPRRTERQFDVVNRRGRGPAFCRSGAGHPVWGREWCLEKGFGLGGGVVILRERDEPWYERALNRVLFWSD